MSYFFSELSCNTRSRFCRRAVLVEAQKVVLCAHLEGNDGKRLLPPPYAGLPP